MDLRPNSCPNMRKNDGICLEEQKKIHKYRPAKVVRANARPVRVFAAISHYFYMPCYLVILASLYTYISRVLHVLILSVPVGSVCNC
jgi:hypothetical protein